MFILFGKYAIKVMIFILMRDEKNYRQIFYFVFCGFMLRFLRLLLDVVQVELWKLQENYLQNAAGTYTTTRATSFSASAPETQRLFRSRSQKFRDIVKRQLFDLSPVKCIPIAAPQYKIIKRNLYESRNGDMYAHATHASVVNIFAPPRRRIFSECGMKMDCERRPPVNSALRTLE